MKMASLFGPPQPNRKNEDSCAWPFAKKRAFASEFTFTLTFTRASMPATAVQTISRTFWQSSSVEKPFG